MKSVTLFSELCLVTIVLLVVSLNGEKFSVIPNPKTEVSEEVAYHKLLKMESDMKASVESLIKKMLPMLLQQTDEIELSGKCVASLLKTLAALKNLKLWAVQLLDATGKPGAGILSGTANELGAYHQCLKVVIPRGSYSTNDQKSIETGQYCVINMRPPLPPRPKKIIGFAPIFKHVNASFKTEVMNEFSEMLFVMYENPMKYGVCIPSTCTTDDLTNMLGFLESELGMNGEVDHCEVPEPFHMSYLQIVLSSLLLSFVIICLVATVISEVDQHCLGSDKSHKDHERYTRQILRSFSVVENFRKLMNTKPVEKRSLDAMNGMRYLSATWVILGHGYMNFNTTMIREPLNIKTLREDFFLTAITGAFVAVESFLFITGVLLSFNVVTYFDKTRSYHPVMNVLRRIWRFLPAMAVTTGVVFLLPLLTSGPDYKVSIEDMAESCQQRWWTNLVFVSNFVPFNKQCLTQLWYVSVDMQLFLASIVYFLILFRNSFFGKVFLALTTFISMVSSGMVTYIMEYPPAVLINAIDKRFIVEFYYNVYALPYVHLGIYSVGLFLGTFLARNKNTSISKTTAVIGWILAVCVGITVVYAVYPWNNNVPYSTVEAVIFSSTQRTVWGLCLAWVVYASYVGKGGYVTSLLSWPGFQPLVKITYALYLVHLPIYLVYKASRLGNQDISNSALVYNFFGTLVASHILAVFLRLFFEAPCIELERVFHSWLNSCKKHAEPKGRNKIEETPNNQLCVQNGSFKLNV